MNIKVAAFTESEKSSNTHAVYVDSEQQRSSHASLSRDITGMRTSKSSTSITIGTILLLFIRYINLDLRLVKSLLAACRYSS